MVTILLIVGGGIVLLSGILTIGACMASARQTENENWSEQPLVSEPLGQPVAQTRRISS